MDAQVKTAQLSHTEAITDLKYAKDMAMARAIAGGNQELFREVYDRNANMLYSLAVRMAGSKAEAEDIVQEAFIKAYQKIDMFAGRSALSSWLYRICVNVGLEHLRRRKGNYEEINDANIEPVEPDQKKLILKRKLDKAIRKLPHGCRTVFVLHEIEGFNHKEIAERLSLSEGTSKSQLFKAREMLRNILTERE